jgi:hypothetical protein
LLDYNELSDEVCEMLKLSGLAMQCDAQYEVGSEEYLWSGDME